jgi:hypothetical protein
MRRRSELPAIARSGSIGHCPSRGGFESGLAETQPDQMGPRGPYRSGEPQTGTGSAPPVHSRFHVLASRCESYSNANASIFRAR